MKKIVNTSKAPNPVGPYNQAIAYGGVLYGSGQVGVDPTTGELVGSSIEEESHQVMKNIGAVLSEAGLNYESILKCTIFVSDMGNYGKINKVYASYFNDDTAPARELVQVSVLPKNVNIEISFLAALE